MNLLRYSSLKAPTTLLAIASLMVTSCGRDPLAQKKAEIRNQFTEASPDFLAKVPLEQRTLTAKEGPSEEIKVGGGTFSIPKPEQIDAIKRGFKAAYPGFAVHFDSMPKKPGLQDLPAAWGSDEIDKMFFICSASGKLIDDATDPEQLSAALVQLTARSNLAPSGHMAGVRKLETPHFKGLLSGDFATIPRMEITLLPVGTKDEFYQIIFTREGEASTEDVLGFLSALKFQAADGP